MKTSIDTEGCESCGLCVDICPEVFMQKGNKVGCIADEVPSCDTGMCMAAVESCPADAITIYE